MNKAKITEWGASVLGDEDLENKVVFYETYDPDNGRALAVTLGDTLIADALSISTKDEDTSLHAIGNLPKVED